MRSETIAVHAGYELGLAKRLEDGIFLWPKIEAVIRLSVGAIFGAAGRARLAACACGTGDADANASGMVVGGIAAK